MSDKNASVVYTHTTHLTLYAVTNYRFTTLLYNNGGYGR